MVSIGQAPGPRLPGCPLWSAGGSARECGRMSNLELCLWAVGLALVFAVLMGPGMWSEKWGWKTLDRITRKKPKAPPPDENPGPR